MAEAPERLIRVGVVARAHGLRGELSVKTDVAGSRTLAGQPRLYLRDATGKLEDRTIRSTRPQGEQMLVVVDGVGDRDAAQALTGREVLLSRDSLPPVEEGEFYAADLIGLPVKTPAGQLLGKVAAVSDAGATPVLEVVGEREWQIPLVDLFVKRVDLAAGELVVEPPVQEES